jgi:hypothetical protein
VTTVPERLGKAALAWLVARASEFDPTSVVEVAQLVRLGEFAMFAHLYARANGRDDATALDLRGLVRAAYDRADVRAALRAALGTTSVALAAWLTIVLGCDDDDRAAAALALIRAHEIDDFATERVAHRQLELAWLVERLRWPSELHADRSALVAASYLGAPRDAARASLAQAYAATHVVAYVTDFGARPRDAVLERSRALDVLRALLGRAEAFGDIDLLGETLAAIAWLDACDDIDCARAWSLVERAACRDGAIVPVMLPNDDRAATSTPFVLAYHSTLVVALAQLARSCERASAVASAAAPASGSSRIERWPVSPR